MTYEARIWRQAADLRIYKLKYIRSIGCMTWNKRSRLLTDAISGFGPDIERHTE